MRITPITLTAAGFALTASSSLLLAQAALPPPVQSTTNLATQAVFDPQQFPAVRGELERMTLSARGDIDGFILKDGTEIKTAPALSMQIASVIRPGDRVTVHGLKAAALPLVSAVSITNDTTQRTVTDSGVSATSSMDPPPPPTPPLRGIPPHPPGATNETSGKVRMALHGPQGEVNGLLLETGTILRFPPDQGGQLVAMIQPHQAVVAEGTAITNALGTVVDVQQLGASRDRLVTVGPPTRPLDDRGLGGPRRHPPPTPDQGAPRTPPPAPPGAAPGPGQGAASLPPAPSAS